MSRAYILTPQAQSYASQLFTVLQRPLMNASVNHTRPLLDALALSLQLAHPSTYSETLHSTGLFSLLISTIVEDKVSLSPIGSIYEQAKSDN